MSRQIRSLFKWCPAPEPPPHFAVLRHYSKPIVAFATTTILIVAILATAFSTLSSTATAPIVGQIQDSLNLQPTPSPSSSPTVTVKPHSTLAPANNPSPTTNPSTVQSTFTVSGYVLDSNGNGVEAAEIIFCVPVIIPAVFTDSSGYYQVSAPTGSYHIYVWPPFNSSYISYEQKELAVNSNVVKNITLNSGFKLSGYITDSGNSVNGAIVALNDYFNGYYSTINGYYYVVAPAGTYTLTAHPKTGVNFAAYNESNVVISGNTEKNITIASQTKYKISGYITDSYGNGLSGAQIIFNVPNIIPGVQTNSAGYYEVYAPQGTYRLNVWPPFDSDYLSYEQQGFIVEGVLTRNFTLTQGCQVSGYITDSAGNPVSGAIVALGNHISGWYSKTSGYYFVTAPPGTYNLTAQPRVGANFTAFSLNNFVVNSNVVQNITVSS